MNDYSTQSEIYPDATWRVIVHRPADGPTNMAIDEAIADRVGDSLSPPTLRFYTWQPVCLSLGYSQPATDVDSERLQERGWDVVRRLTGGRAILHADELTYSVAIPARDPRVSGGVIESYRRLSYGLLTGLNYLGVSAQTDKAAEGAHRFKGPVCFEVPSDYEITVGGKKLLGSAQSRRGEVVLQHGALPLYGDITRICDVLIFGDDKERASACKRVLARAITLEGVLGKRIEVEHAVSALVKGFAEALNLQFEEAQLSEAEQTRADELRATKYTTHDWTHRH